jgi:TonB family protein
MKRSSAVTLGVVMVALAVRAPAGAREAERPAPVDLRRILVGDTLDPEKAAQAGLDVSQMRPPRPKKQVAPLYPDSSVRRGREVEVVTECRIDADGVPRDCQVTRSDDSFLSEAVLAAIKQWRYEPLRVRDVPTPALVAITIRFDPGST